MKSTVTAIVLAAAAFVASAAPVAFDPEVDSDRPGRTPLHATTTPLERILVSRGPGFNPEVDSDRLASPAGVRVNETVARRAGSFDPEVDADKDLASAGRSANLRTLVGERSQRSSTNRGS